MQLVFAQSSTPPSQMTARSGNAYPVGANGTISVPVGLAQDLIDALANGFTPVPENPLGYVANAATSAATASVASVAGANENILNMSGTLSAGANLTLPTAALILAGRPSGGYVGESWRVRVINSGAGAFSWTLTTAAGLTLTGTLTVAQNTWREFLFTVTGVGASAAITVQSIGTGTNS